MEVQTKTKEKDQDELISAILQKQKLSSKLTPVGEGEPRHLSFSDFSSFQYDTRLGGRTLQKSVLSTFWKLPVLRTCI